MAASAREQNRVLLLDQVSVRIQGKVIFQNLTFSVAKGEIWAIVGNSGCGKTALLSVISGQLCTSGGTTKRYFNETLLKTNAKHDPLFAYHDLISFVPARHTFRNLSNTTSFYYQQRYNAFDAQDASTVSEYLKGILSTSGRQQNSFWTYEKTISLLNLSPLEDKQLIKLSNGETKRLMIAAGLIKNPHILLLDNPLSGLDVATKNAFGDILQEINASGINVIITTNPHNIPEHISHVALIENGAIAFADKIEMFKPDGTHRKVHAQIETDHLKRLLKSNSQKFRVIVDMEDVKIAYGKLVILENINWKVLPGEAWALSGPNGSGKSTLLSLIYGDHPQAYANNINLFDKQRGSGESIWEIKNKIGFVSPELHQYFPTDNTCIQVIESGFYDTQGLFRKSDPPKRALALQWMEVLGIYNLRDTYFKSLSSSQQRLCLLARAIIKNPPLLLLDEPCQGLDREQQFHFRSIVDFIYKRGNTTVIYVTHDEEDRPDCVKYELKLKSSS